MPEVTEIAVGEFIGRRHRTGRTEVFDEDDNRIFTVPRTFPVEHLDLLAKIYNEGHRNGRRLGRKQLQGQLCALLGAEEH